MEKLSLYDTEFNMTPFSYPLHDVHFYVHYNCLFIRRADVKAFVDPFWSNYMNFFKIC